MKTQITRFSPHQNAKVLAVLMAVSTFVVAMPFLLISLATMPEDAGGMPLMMVVFLPVLYFVVGYLMVAVGCWLYNVMFKYIGGIEYEMRDDAS